MASMSSWGSPSASAIRTLKLDDLPTGRVLAPLSGWSTEPNIFVVASLQPRNPRSGWADRQVDGREVRPPSEASDGTCCDPRVRRARPGVTGVGRSVLAGRAARHAWAVGDGGAWVVPVNGVALAFQREVLRGGRDGSGRLCRDC